MQTRDFLVIGAGVIGLTTALELRRRHPDASITVIDKERELGAHGSGRNSGVLHAGFYYSADSHKARFTREGNLAWQAYCDDKGLRINRCGKLVVAHDAGEVEGLRELKRRGDRNGVPLEWMTAAEAREVEPRVKTHEHALWSSSTASVDPGECMAQLAADAREARIELRLGVAYQGRGNGAGQVQVGSERFDCGTLINAGGLYADRIARDWGLSGDYTILPFKGLYLYPAPDAYRPATNIYPVPNLKNPFLGVHFTTTVSGTTKIGPTAIPAFWREHYTGWDNFSLRELLQVVGQESALFFTNAFGFRDLAFEEAKKYRRRYMVECAQRMLEGVEDMGFTRWGKPGIRAQLLNTKKRALEMDFIVEQEERSLHVLNAVSPAWTCAFPFARYLADRLNDMAR